MDSSQSAWERAYKTPNVRLSDAKFKTKVIHASIESVSCSRSLLPVSPSHHCRFGKSIIILMATMEVWIKFTSLTPIQFENYFVISQLHLAHTPHAQSQPTHPAHTHTHTHHRYVLLVLFRFGVFFWSLITDYVTRFPFWKGLIARLVTRAHKCT